MSNKWDDRFLALAEHVASWSKDESTKVGAVITHGKRIVSLGYNGFAEGMNDDPALYADREIKYQRIIHAEMNAREFARRDLRGCTLYSTLMPCDRCFPHLIQARIRRFVYPMPKNDEPPRPWFNIVRAMALEANAEMVEVTV